MEYRRNANRPLKIEEAFQKESLPQAANDLIKEGLEEQKKMLQSGMARPVTDFASLLRQPVHGDYHEGNVIFDSENRVEAVVDWEMVGTGTSIRVRLFQFGNVEFREQLAQSLVQAFHTST